MGHVYALDDQQVVDPLLADTVTHTAGGDTVVTGISEARATGDRGGRDVDTITPQVQRLEPVTMPSARFGVDHWFEWRPDAGDEGRWDLVLEWKRDPGTDVEFEVTARSADRHGVDLGGA